MTSLGFFSSSEWNMLTEADRQKHGITFDDDGEFWSVKHDTYNKHHSKHWAGHMFFFNNYFKLYIK